MNSKIIARIKNTQPRIHSITNTITINDCANIVLAAGGKATMASDPAEAGEMTSHCDGLVLNLGAVSSLDAMIKAGKVANALQHPIVFDPVAAGATELRRKASLLLMQKLKLTAIRGNAAEIHTLAVLSRMSASSPDNSSFKDNPDIHSFVDADENSAMKESNRKKCLQDAGELSAQTGAIVIVSGEEDLVVQKEHSQILQGGSSLSARITGSGCMLTELISVCLAAVTKNPEKQDEKTPFSAFDAVCTAVEWMNHAAEQAEKLTAQNQGGTMTYRMHLIDAVSKM